MEQLTYQLVNGVQVPTICLGPGIIHNNVQGTNSIVTKIINMQRVMKASELIKRAPGSGCFCFDTSSAYGDSELIIGNALKRHDRNQIFLTTKISNFEQRNMKVRDALMGSMRRLGVDYLDLYLMHWPQKGTFRDTWKQMEELYSEGIIKAIGVCNFHIHHFEELYSVAQIKPMVHQFEIHPLFSQKEQYEFCQKEKIQVMAYTPVARGDDRLMNNHLLARAAKRHGKSIIQVVLRWHLQKGNIPVIRTNSLDHLKENLNIYDFVLSDKEMNRIDSININSRLRYDSDNCDFIRL